MLLSKAIEGFILDGLAGSYSPHTVRLYQSNLGIYLDLQGSVLHYPTWPGIFKSCLYCLWYDPTRIVAFYIQGTQI
jgi:hypothetical protein